MSKLHIHFHLNCTQYHSTKMYKAFLPELYKTSRPNWLRFGPIRPNGNRSIYFRDKPHESISLSIHPSQTVFGSSKTRFVINQIFIIHLRYSLELQRLFSNGGECTSRLTAIFKFNPNWYKKISLKAIRSDSPRRLEWGRSQMHFRVAVHRLQLLQLCNEIGQPNDVHV